MNDNPYQVAANRAETPRGAEYRLLCQITAEMMAARDTGLTGAPLVSALHRNRELWAVFASDCAAPGNGLPVPLRAQIVSLALWVERFTSDVAKGDEAVDPLIELNRSVMEGLRGETLAA